MSSRATTTGMRRAPAVAAALVAIGISGGCGLGEVKMPGFDGPATTALSFVLTATPDVVTADGLSSSVIVATLRGPDGVGIPGREIIFVRLDDALREAAIGRLSADRATTGSDGRARVVYTSPPRNEFDAHAWMFVQARPVGDDFAGYDLMERTVRIELLPVDDRRYPPNPGGEGPVCSYVREPRFGFYYVGVPIRFQSTSYDPDGYITRYEWTFADGSTALGPDVYHTYYQAGEYYVRHVVVDNDGLYDSCNLLTIVVAAP